MLVSELHLVAQPQGPRRPQPLRGRLPGPRQHRRLRPQRAAADGRLPGTGRRHGLDGVLRAEHARHRAGAGAGRSRRTRSWPSSSTSTSSAIAAATNQNGGRDAHVGRGGRLLLRRAARARAVHDAPQGALDRRPAPAVRGLGLHAGGAARSCRDFVRARRSGSTATRPDLLANLRPARRPAPTGASCCRCSPTTSCAGVLARMLDPERVPGRPRHPLAVALPPATTRTCSTSAAQDYRVGYLPAESDTGMFGGNSNWRGPIWAPINALIVRALLADVRVLRRRVPGRVPDRFGAVHDAVRGGARSCRTAWPRSSCATTRAAGPSTAARRSSVDDPHWNDHVLFYEYFHGDNGAGLGASHQTGWTAIIPAMMQLFAQLSPEKVLHPERQPGRAWRASSDRASTRPGAHP